MSNNEAVSGGGLRWSEILAPLLLVAFAFAWVYGVGGASTRIMQSYHGFHHAAYVTQIANGIVPPTNPSSAGAPANFYWAWHAALAFGVWSMNVTPFEMSLSSNALGLAMALCGFWLCSGAFTRDPWLRLTACALPLFILNPLGFVQFAVRLGFVWIPAWFGLGSGEGFAELVELSRHHAALGLVDHELSHLAPRLGLMPDVVLLDRAGHWLPKFLNYNSFPVALGVYALAMDAFVTQRFGVGLRALGLAVACCAMALLSPLVVVAFGCSVLAMIIVEGPIEWRALRKTGFVGRRAGLVRFAGPMLGCAVGVLCALPMLWPISQAYGGESVFMLGRTGFGRHALALGWALLPSAALLAAAVGLARHLDAPARVHAISLALLSTLALCVAIPIQDPNEYKFVLVAAFPAGLLVLGLLGAWARRSRSIDAVLRRPAWLASAFLAGGVAAVASTALLYLASPWAEQDPLRLHDATTQLAANGDTRLRDFDEALTWLRERTPVDSYVFAVARDKNADPIPTVAQRRVVVQKPSPFTAGVADHDARLGANAALIEAATRCADTAEIDRAVAKVQALKLPFESVPYALIERGVGHEACEGTAALQPVHRTDAFTIFEVRALAPDA